MGLSRRQLLTRGGIVGASTVAAAGGYLAGRQLAQEDDAGAEQPDGARTEPEGPLFALDPDYVNLTTFVLASHPRPVRAAIERHRRALDKDAALYLRSSEVSLEEASRRAVAGYLGTEPELVALTDSTTMGLALVYARLRLGPGEEVVTTEHDFFATHESLRLRERLDGVAVRRIRLYDEPETASAEEIVTAVSRALRPSTRCLALTWVHSSSGVKLPLREITDAVAAANRGRRERERILLCVDGVHGSASRTSRRSISASTSSRRDATSGCSARAGPASSGQLPMLGRAWRRRSPPSTRGCTSPGSSAGSPMRPREPS